MRSLIAIAFFSVLLGAPPVRAEDALRTLVEAFLTRETSQLQGRLNIVIAATALPAQTRPCAAPQAFLPSGRAAWGRTTVGVRCTAPRWVIYVPAQVQLFGPYLVASRALASGSVLTASDWRIEHGDIAAQRPGVLTEAKQAEGRSLRQAVAAGSALRADQLLSAPVIQRGDSVRVVASGAGFAVQNEGIAMATVSSGQTLEIKLANGRRIRAKARADGSVEAF